MPSTHQPSNTPSHLAHDALHGVRRVQSAFMEISALGKEYLHPAQPPVWVELLRLMGSWHLNEVDDLGSYFNLRFPRHGVAVLEAISDLGKWVESLNARQPYTLGKEGADMKLRIESLTHAKSRLEDIVRSFHIGEAVAH